MDHLLHKPYVEEVADCLQLVRQYFSILGIEIRDYAFPSDFWDYEDSMYERLFAREGFVAIDSDEWKPQVSDVLLVPGSVRVTFPTHAGIIVDDSKVLHHYPNRLSEVTAFKGVWRTPTVALRHKSLFKEITSVKTTHIAELMPDHVKRRLYPNREPIPA